MAAADLTDTNGLAATPPPDAERRERIQHEIGWVAMPHARRPFDAVVHDTSSRSRVSGFCRSPTTGVALAVVVVSMEVALGYRFPARAVSGEHRTAPKGLHSLPCGRSRRYALKMHSTSPINRWPSSARADENVVESRHPPRPLCPQCLSGYGDARIVTMRGGNRTITYVCDHCLHEWEVVDKPKTEKTA